MNPRRGLGRSGRRAATHLSTSTSSARRARLITFAAVARQSDEDQSAPERQPDLAAGA